MHNPTELAREIFKRFSDQKVSAQDGRTGLMTALIISMIDDGLDKERAARVFDEVWDLIEPFIRARLDARAKH
jgi:hypothetical protein